MAEKLTPQQLQAVTDRGGDLLVSAAAGSGKTKVLVDRLLSYLTDPNDPADLDSFLIITYTKAAAAELRGKIASKLSEKIAEDPSNRHLQQQMQQLYLTKISTVHSFCADIIREYAYKLDVAADFRVADETECMELQMRAMDQLLESAYAHLDEDPDLKAFVDTQGLGRDDRMIPLILMKVYSSAQCHLDPDGWLSWCIEAVQLENVLDASQTVWGAYLVADLHQYLQSNIEALERCAALALASDGMEKPAALLADTVIQLTNLLKCKTWDEIFRNKSIDFGRLVFPKKCADTELAEQIKAIRSSCKKGLEKKLRTFADRSDQVLADLSASADSVRGIVSLVKQFTQLYDKLKRSRRVLDFGDLEHKMLDLLHGKHRTGLTAAAAEIGSRFREIMVDEYQDSNQVQDSIFSALSADRHNCFMVGDVKQSIYQFRLADPSIFIDKYDIFLPAERASDGQGRKVLLSSNFRSGAEVISTVNDVFTTCMSKRVGGLDYGEEEMLREGIPHAPLPDPAVELYGIRVREDTYAEEAAFTADRVAQLLDGSHLIRSGEQFRPIKPEDIVILLRSPGSVGGEFQYALEQRGIRCTTGNSTDLLQTEEVSTLRSLLQVISNPLQDIPLTAVLMSRTFGFTADDMAQLRAENRWGDLYHALGSFDKAASFLRCLTELRQEARISHLSQLVQKIFLLTRIDSIYSAMPDGPERVANLHAFYQMVSDYDASGRRDLGQFLEHLDAVEARGLSTAADQQQTGFVTIMSIHKSKGLEFPVVFLCGLSRSFNQESAREQVLCDRQLGLGLNCVDGTQRVRYPSVAKRAIAAKMVDDSISEEMRVLYVAMTRAKDRLIMTYAANNLDTDLRNIVLRIDLSHKKLMTGQVDCPGNWVMQAALKRTEAGAFFAVAGKPAETSVSDHPWLIRITEADDASIDEAEESEESAALPQHLVSDLARNLSFVYPHSAATQSPSKQTATQLKGRMKDQEAAEDTAGSHRVFRRFRKPAFLQSKAGGVEYGSAMHAAMQYIHFASCDSAQAVCGDIQRMVGQKLLSAEQAEMVNCEQIANFFATNLGSRLRSAKDVLREFKFSILDDGEHYGSGIAGEQVLLQGVVDCAMIEDDGISIVDFKTDKVTEHTLTDVAQSYRLQVEAYMHALERIYRKPVKTAQLYFFRLNRFVSIR